MYGDLLLDRLGVKFLGPAPLHLELLHMLTTFHRNALGSTLGWWFCLLRRRLRRRKQISPVERMNITLVPGGNMVVLSSSISVKVSKMSCHECKGCTW